MTRQPDIHSQWLARIAAALTALVGLTNVASALKPGIRWRGHLLLSVEPLQAMRVFHALALPLGAALLLVAPYLFKRRRRALWCGIALMLVLGFVNLLKGLDVGECVLGWVVAGVLYADRAEFTVEHEPITLRSAVWRAPAIGAGGIVLLLLLHRRAHWPWIALAAHLLEVATLLGMAYAVFRPLAWPRSLPGTGVRSLAAQVVREYGRDTLAFFKLRPDKLLFFNAGRTAFVGYRIDAGVIVLSGDPVGPPAAFPELLREVRHFAHQRGLKLAALGASPALAEIYRELGLRALYLGDEAVVELDGFTLEGRPIRKVRQSVARLQRAGYSAELRALAEIAPAEMGEIEHVMEVGRIGDAERGFAMGMDGIRGVLEQDTVFVLARDEHGTIRGMLHFVPCYGRSAVSLSMMRRDPETPNGLMEFLIVTAIEGLRTRGVKEMSLNFAALTKYLRNPEGIAEHALGWIAKRLDGHLQIESLYRANAKFLPRWDPRYLIYEGRLDFPRAVIATMRIEGQLPKPELPHWQTHLGQRTIKFANR